MNRKGKVPMLDVDGFRRYLKPMLNSQQPFLAWWHPSGFGCVMTGAAEPWTGNGRRVVNLKPLSAAHVNRYRKMIEKLERTTWPVYTVEFDGAQTITTGGFEL